MFIGCWSSIPCTKHFSLANVLQHHGKWCTLTHALLHHGNSIVHWLMFSITMEKSDVHWLMLFNAMKKIVHWLIFSYPMETVHWTYSSVGDHDGKPFQNQLSIYQAWIPTSQWDKREHWCFTSPRFSHVFCVSMWGSSWISSFLTPHQFSCISSLHSWDRLGKWSLSVWRSCACSLCSRISPVSPVPSNLHHPCQVYSCL